MINANMVSIKLLIYMATQLNFQDHKIKPKNLDIFLYFHLFMCYNMKIQKKDNYQFMHITILTLISLSFSLNQGSCFPSLAQSDLSNLIVIIQYQQAQSNATQYKTDVVYHNNTVNSTFLLNQNIFDCGNMNLFILNQTEANDNYRWIFTNFSIPINVQINSGFQNPSVQFYNCSSSPCQIPVSSNCPSIQYSNNFVAVIVLTNEGNQVITFSYYTQCNLNNVLYIYQGEWGLIILTVATIIIIIVCSKFQETQSFGNFTLYVNYIVVGAYSSLNLLRYFLIYYEVSNFILMINYMCLTCSFIFGILGVMICFCQLAYYTRIYHFRRVIFTWRITFRVMDALGFVLGIILLCAWFFSFTNAILSDIIFLMIYLSLVKIVKFGNLKIAVIIFAINFAINCAFYKTASSIDSAYLDSRFDYFNNPLFFLVPVVIHIPNIRCNWHSILTMSYAGLLLAYFERFDKNKSSAIYVPIFMICYSFGSIVWFIVSNFTPFPLPYDLFSIPFSLIVLMIFANRRNQLINLWIGHFYDEQRISNRIQNQMNQRLQSMNEGAFGKNLLQNLKVDRNGSLSLDITSKKQHHSSKQGKSKQQKSEKKDKISINSQAVNQTILSDTKKNSQMPTRRPAWRSQIPLTALILQSTLKKENQ